MTPEQAAAELELIEIEKERRRRAKNGSAQDDARRPDNIAQAKEEARLTLEPTLSERAGAAFHGAASVLSPATGIMSAAAGPLGPIVGANMSLLKKFAGTDRIQADAAEQDPDAEMFGSALGHIPDLVGGAAGAAKGLVSGAPKLLARAKAGVGHMRMAGARMTPQLQTELLESLPVVGKPAGVLRRGLQAEKPSVPTGEYQTHPWQPASSSSSMTAPRLTPTAAPAAPKPAPVPVAGPAGAPPPAPAATAGAPAPVAPAATAGDDMAAAANGFDDAGADSFTKWTRGQAPAPVPRPSLDQAAKVLATPTRAEWSSLPKLALQPTPAAPTPAAPVLAPRLAPTGPKGSRWDDAFDEAGLHAGLQSSKQLNPSAKLAWQKAAESLGQRPTKGGLQRVPEQIKATQAAPDPNATPPPQQMASTMSQALNAGKLTKGQAEKMFMQMARMESIEYASAVRAAFEAM